MSPQLPPSASVAAQSTRLLRHRFSPVLQGAMILLLGLSLGGCLQKKGSSAAPPTGILATAGDGQVTMSWTGESGVDYWLFGAADAAISSDNWFKLTGALSHINVTTPFTVCGLTNDTAYYFSLNGRRDEGPGGAFSAPVSATPRLAGQVWQANATVGTDDWNGTTERGGQTCTDTPLTTMVNYVAVGSNGKVMTSLDARNWTAAASLPAGFTTTLNAVTSSGGTSARWVAVGDQGATLISVDGATWTPGREPSASLPALRGIANNGSTYVAVGDGGTIETSTDGVTWTVRTSGVTDNLRAIAYTTKGNFIAVGDAGAILVSADVVNWTKIDSGTGNALTTVATGVFVDSSSTSFFGAIVAGAGGTVLLSTDGGLTFNASSPGVAGSVDATTNFVAATHGSRFALIDALGRTWGTVDGVSWVGPFDTLQTSPKATVSANGRYLVVGTAGGSSVSF